MEQWEQAIESFRRKLVTEPLKVAQETARLAGNEVIDNTPVLTGHLRFGWQGSIGSPVMTEREGTDKSGETVKAEMLNSIKKIAPGTIFYFTNPVSYGVYVEHGTSTRAARLFVAAVTAKLKIIAEQAARNVASKK